jgi:hypothetical protein
MSGEDTRRSLDARLDNIYKVLADLVMQEDERYTDSLNIFILVQTIFFAGLIQLNMLDKSQFSSNQVLFLVKTILPLLGTLLCINAIYSFHRRIGAIGYWKACLYRIEADSDFIGGQYGKGLDIFTSRKAHLVKKHSKYPGLLFNILKYQRYFMPLAFLIIWMLILGAQLFSYL